jgi:hypothetical protein
VKVETHGLSVCMLGSHLALKLMYYEPPSARRRRSVVGDKCYDGIPTFCCSITTDRCFPRAVVFEHIFFSSRASWFLRYYETRKYGPQRERCMSAGTPLFFTQPRAVPSRPIDTSALVLPGATLVVVL